MKKLFTFALVMLFASTAAFAADFAPTLLKVSADPLVQYDFDGSELTIPVTVSGTAAGLMFLVYTKDEAANIVDVQNGYLGWHYVNKVDTCVYYSSLQNASVGSVDLTWDGTDQDGGIVPAGEYTYYIWAFDNQSSKTLMSEQISYDRSAKIQEIGTDGLPLSNPIWYNFSTRWAIGNDPMDPSLVETSNVSVAEGWSTWGAPEMEQTDFDYFYLSAYNKDATLGTVHKYRWVPGGDAELQSDFGEDGFGDTFTALYFSSTGSSGPTIEGDYIYNSSRCGTCTEPASEFFVYDKDGFIVERIDLSEWWSSLEDYEAGGQMNGGPSYFTLRNGMITMNHYGTCMHQMVNPSGYLESGDMADFWVWTNQNGDYVLDHNFEETSAKAWVCHDFNVGPYIYTLGTDANSFTVGNAYDVGAVSFGLLGPDGTGLGYLGYSGETAGWKRCTLVVDSDTPYDGFYCDNMQTGGTHYEWDKEKIDYSMYFIGHDSIKGVITNAVGVQEAPAAFAVDQNVPNPFNPTTTITFSLAQAGDVTVDVFNVAGQKVDTLVDGYMDAGQHSAVWDASGFSAGVYFYTVKSAGFSQTMKMTLVK